MKNFVIEFEFEGATRSADVMEIGGLDDTQYVISPKDEDIGEKYKSNTIRKLNDGSSSQYTIPAVVGGDEFMQALSNGLDRYLAAK